MRDSALEGKNKSAKTRRGDQVLHRFNGSDIFSQASSPSSQLALLFNEYFFFIYDITLTGILRIPVRITKTMDY